jgi:hypothetical protein
VHAVNPYGFKHHRRVNEDNVDLNRNFLSGAEWSQVKALDPNYARHIDFKDIINPTCMPFPFLWMNDLYQLVRSGFYMLKYGKDSIKTALVSGNYINPTGYSYGGSAHTQSARNLIDLLVRQLDLPHQAEKLVLIDVHSGLGPSGVDTLLDVGLSPAFVESVFPTEYNKKGEAIGALKTNIAPPSSASLSASGAAAAADEVSKGYEMVKGVITGGFCNDMVAPRLHGQDKLCVTQVYMRQCIVCIPQHRRKLIKHVRVLLLFLGIRDAGCDHGGHGKLHILLPSYHPLHCWRVFDSSNFGRD